MQLKITLSEFGDNEFEDDFDEDLGDNENTDD